MEMTTENLRPISNEGPGAWPQTLKFYGRMVLDFQILTIFRDLKAFLPQAKGRVLDVGCGQSPYRFLLDPKLTSYQGIDIADADKFDYRNREIIAFDGKTIPFPNDSFDFFLCTEVLEHVQDYQFLVNEIYRVLKVDGAGIVTVPWSARTHYVPFDYFRYTPSTLQEMFKKFRSVKVAPRGSDLTSISGKLVVFYARTRPRFSLAGILTAPFWLLLAPFILFFVLLGHVSLWLHLGSKEDPLGYTIWLQK